MIGDAPDDFVGALRVVEFTQAVQRGGIENDVVMDMSLVLMCGNDERMVAFRETHRQFVADLICSFGGDLAGLERLSDVVGEDVVFALISVGERHILVF